MAHLLYWYRSDPGLTGDPCTHIGVWKTLEKAQAYSEECGGKGDWDAHTYDAVDYWIRPSDESYRKHVIEEIGGDCDD